MSLRGFAFIIGTLYIGLGLIGLSAPGLVIRPSDFPGGPEISFRFGYVVGLFPVNTPLNLLHLGTGIWGVSVAHLPHRAKLYALSVAILYGLLTVVGFVPGLNYLFGFLPLWGHNIWFHGVTAGLASYFSVARSRAKIPSPA